MPDIDLAVILNGKYRTSSLRTDKNGIFQINVPAGDWYFTLIEVEGWKNAPKNSNRFSLIKPDEDKYVSGKSYYRRGFIGESLGIPIVETKRPGEKPLTLTIVRNIPIDWSKAGTGAVNASVERDILRWEASPNADRYLAKIWRVERNGSRTGSYLIVSRETENTVLPLSELTVSTNSFGETEYKLQVLAFDKNGDFLGRVDVSQR